MESDGTELVTIFRMMWASWKIFTCENIIHLGDDRNYLQNGGKKSKGDSAIGIINRAVHWLVCGREVYGCCQLGPHSQVDV